MHTIKKIFYILCILAIMFAFFCIIHCVLNWYNAKNQSNLLNEIIINQNVESNQIIENIYSNEHFQDLGNSESENIITERMLKVQELKKQNEDIVAWLEIEGTKINYPVLQYTDNSFYMNHDYKKSYSSSGSIYLDKDYNFDEKSANLLIYGHNMKNGTMFRDLLKYSDKAFYDSHPTIRFTTTNEDSVFEIISVFKSRVYYKSEENVFRYYYFVNAETEDEYNEFVKNAINSSLYNISKTAEYPDTLLTLSTCAYHTTDRKICCSRKKKEHLGLLSL